MDMACEERRGGIPITRSLYKEEIKLGAQALCGEI